MKWPLLSRPIPNRDIPTYNRYYLHAAQSSRVDSTMLMGTDIEADSLLAFLQNRNRDARVVITTAHVLVRATALALEKFPEMNVRVVGHRVYAFRDINIRMAYFHRKHRDIDVMMISSANRKSLEQIAQDIWERMLEAGRGEGGRERDLARLRSVPVFWFRQMLRVYRLLDRVFPMPTVSRLDELRSGCALVNDLSSSGIPSIRSYKPSRFPDDSDSFNLTLGPVENRVVARGDGFESIRMMPIFVRADHRLTDAYQLGRFLAVVRDFLQNPETLNEMDDRT